MSVSQVLNGYLKDAHAAYDVLEHPYTSDSLATAHSAHVNPDMIAKAVVVKHNAGHYTMCVIPASHHLILEWLEYEQQLSFELAEESELVELFPDCERGAVPCIGQAYNMDVILDTALMDENDIYFEGGDHRHLVHMTSKDFQDLMDDAWQAVISCPVRDEFEQTLH